jgi:hypothetical protein
MWPYGSPRPCIMDFFPNFFIEYFSLQTLRTIKSYGSAARLEQTKEWLDVAIWLQVIFSEYSKVFRIGTKSVTQNRCKKFPQAT